MPQYIDKDAVVEEIEKRIGNCAKQREDMLNVQCYTLAEDASARIGELNCIQDFIDTLDVKDVDLEKIINDYFKDWKFDDELDIMVKPNNYSASFADLKEIAKYFFELGLKAQKL